MEAVAQPAQELLKADSGAEGRAAAVHIIARSDTPVAIIDTLPVARAASCPEPLPAAVPAGGNSHVLHHLLLKGLAKAGVSMAGAVSARATKQARPEGEDALPSSPSSTGSTRYIKPLTPAQSGECYRSPTCALAGGSSSLCQSDVDMGNHKWAASLLMVSGAGSMEPLEEDDAPEAEPNEEAASDGGAAPALLSKELKENVQKRKEPLDVLEEPGQALSGVAEENHAGGDDTALPVCATAGLDTARAAEGAETAGKDGVAATPALLEEVPEGPEPPAGGVGVEPAAVEAAGEQQLAGVDIQAVKEAVATEGGSLSELSKLAINASIDEEVEFQGCGVPSAFADTSFGAEEGDVDKDEPTDCLTELPSRPSHLKLMRTVRFSQSFDGAESECGSEWEGLRRAASARPPLAPSGGSVSLAAQHFCPVCGIIATSQANLEDHMTGRRHARRLQYIRNMPESERTMHMERVASGEWHLLARKDSGSSTGSHGGEPGSGKAHTLLRIGSITLPSSMDLRQYLDELQEVEQQEASPRPKKAAIKPAAPADSAGAVMDTAGKGSLLCQEQAEDEQHCVAEQATVCAPAQPAGEDADDGARSDAGSAFGSADSGSFAGEGAGAGAGAALDGEEDGAPRERHECVVCGITTTSAAHLEAHLRGRKHKRRVEVSGARPARPSAHYCATCDITTTSAQHMAMHVAGKAHCRRLATGHLPAAAVQKVAAAEEAPPANGVGAAASAKGAAMLQERPATGASSALAADYTDRTPCAVLQPIRLADVGAHAARQKALAGMQARPRAQQQALAATLQQQQQMHMQQAPYGYQYMGYFPGQPYFQPHLPRGQPAYVPHWAQWVPPSASFGASGDQRAALHMTHMHQAHQGTALQPITLQGAYMSGVQQQHQQQQLPSQTFSPRYAPGGAYPLHQPHPGMGAYFGAVPDFNDSQACGTAPADADSQPARARAPLRRVNSGRVAARA